MRGSDTLSLLKLCFLLVTISAYNIDVESPYVIKGSQDGSFFGFSTALHIYQVQGLKYILVGAPKSNWTTGLGMDIPSPGAVYKCPLSRDISDPTEEAVCEEQITYLTENNAANAGLHEDKSNQWLGVNVQSTDSFVSACAHRYTMANDEGKIRAPIGKCTVIGPALDGSSGQVQWRTVDPCSKNKPNEDTNSCQAGASQVQRMMDGQNDAYLFYGAPGEKMWEGSAYVAVGLDDIKLSKGIDKGDGNYNTEFNLNQYTGYGVSICKMSGKDPIDFIVSAPRANDYYGKLYFYNSNPGDTSEEVLFKNTRLKDELSGDQMGAYFGYSMACGDLDNDGAEDLLVSAPWYSVVTTAKSSIISVGRVYVYYGDRDKVVQNANQPVIIEAPSTTTSAFGLGLAKVGDINNDGFTDFAIGAPYENDMKGAVYLYHGSYSGIKKTPAQAIHPTSLGSDLGANLRTFGWSISADKDMDENSYPDIAIGSYTSDRVVYLRSLPIVDLDIEIVIPPTPIDLEEESFPLPDGSASYPGTTLKICFTPKVISTGDTTSYEVQYEIFLDYKQSYAPRAFFQSASDTTRKFQKKGAKVLTVQQKIRQCTEEWTVYLKKKNEMFDDKNYIEVNMTANIKESSTFDKRAVLKQEQVEKAEGKIVIKSICQSQSGICKCDISLNPPTVKYFPVGYDSIVLDNVNQVIVQYEVVNMGPDNAHLPTLKVRLPPKVYFIRRTPVDGQTEADVSSVACSEIEEDGINMVLCYLMNPLPVGVPSRFGISLDTMSLGNTDPITLQAEVSIGSPSEEDAANTSNNRQSITLEVGEQADLEIRGMSATERNAIKPDPALAVDNAFLTNIKLEVRHTVSVSVIVDEGEEEEVSEEGIKDIVVEVNWPMKDRDGNYLLYLSEVYVKDNQIKDNFVVNSSAIDPDCLFNYSGRCVKKNNPQYSAVADDDDDTTLAADTTPSSALNTNCSVPDPGCVTFDVTINLLKSGSINMKKLEFEMRSIIWLPNILNRGDFNTTSTARIKSVGQNLVIRPGSYVEMNTQVYEEISKEKDILWIIIGAVVGGLVILFILIVVLWKVGFFKRKMPPKDGSGM